MLGIHLALSRSLDIYACSISDLLEVLDLFGGESYLCYCSRIGHVMGLSDSDEWECALGYSPSHSGLSYRDAVLGTRLTERLDELSQCGQDLRLSSSRSRTSELGVGCVGKQEA